MLHAAYSVLLVASLFVGGIAQSTTPRANPSKELSRHVHTYLSRLEKFGYSGVVLVAKDRRIVTERSYGLADKQKGIPVTTDTIFDIGSLTKQFTAAAIVLLESDSKLHVGDPISKYLTTVPPDKQAVTIHHLLTHTSGLRGDFGGDYDKVSRDEHVRRALESKLDNAPGEHHAYSNAGYSLLAAIVEIVSGQNYETFLRERLFEPAGMSSTGYTFSGAISGRLARGYINGKDWGIGAERAAATGGNFWNLIGNGGIHSTAGDLYRWMSALEQGKVLTKGAREKLFQPHVVAISNYKNSGTPLHYAYGWYVWKQPSGKTLIWHLGGNGIFNAAVRHHLDEGAFVIYMCNVSEFSDPDYPVPAIERMLAGQQVEMPPLVAQLKANQSAEYAGRYVSKTGGTLSAQPEDTHLRVEGEGQEALSFVTSGRWQRDATLDAFNPLASDVVESSRTGAFGTTLNHYGADTTLEGLSEFEASFWKKRHDLYGNYVRTRILGTVQTRGRTFKGRTLVAIDFERGTAFREYLWTPAGKIGDVGPVSVAPSSQFFPVSKGCFVRFSAPEARESARICIGKDKTGKQVATLLQDGKQILLEKL